jgi:probable F420-dependent oxidoreductase
VYGFIPLKKLEKVKGGDMESIRIGVQMEPQHTTYAAFMHAVHEVEALGVDTLWTWDHLFPPYESEIPPKGRPGLPWGNHFEAWTLLTAMATLTQRVEIGHLVTCNSYRNPSLLSIMAKTVDHICHGRLILGLDAGWREVEYRIFGYHFGTAADRLRLLEESLTIIKQRWSVDLPFPVRNPIPILIGGDGEKITLRLVALYADLWNSLAFGSEFEHKNQVLDQWCQKVGRDPADIERTVTLGHTMNRRTCGEFITLGAQHLILDLGEPWDLRQVEKLVRWRDDNR